MTVIKQILKEFWIPFIIAAVWTVYNIIGISTENWTAQKIINTFGPSFFLISWMTGQFFRVKKQTKVEDSFGKMETRFGELLTAIDSKTQEMISNITGGDSFPYLIIGSIDSLTDSGMLMAVNKGNYTLFDVNARICNINKLTSLKGNVTFDDFNSCNENLFLGNLMPGMVGGMKTWKIESNSEISYNIFFAARNGSFIQTLILKKLSNKWESATKVTDSNNKLLYEDISLNFPKNDQGSINWSL